MRKSYVILIMLLGAGLWLFGLPHESQAGFLDIYGIGAKPIGLAGAYTAIADDPSAAYYNPAGLAQMEGLVDVSFAYLYTINGFEITGGESHPVHPGSSDGLRTATILAHLGIDELLEIERPLDVGVFVTIGKNLWYAAGMYIRPPDHYTFDMYDRNDAFVIGGSVGTEVLPDLYLGAGLQLLLQIHAGISVQALETALETINHIQTQGGKFVAIPRGTMDISINAGLSPMLGMLYRYNDKISIGAAWHRYNDIEGNMDVDVYASGENMPFLSVPMKIADQYIPENVRFGVSYRLDNMLFDFDISEEFWGARKKNNLEPEMDNWNNVIVPKIGVQYFVSQLLDLRAGYCYYPSPIPDQPGDTNYADANRHIIALGAGYTYMPPIPLIRNPMKLEAFMNYHFLETRHYNKSESSMPDYDASGYMLLLGAAFTTSY